jgi:uncharacterized protein YllA (UPF0747 family)
MIKLKAALFPNNGLQERTENIAGFYAKYGDEIFDKLLQQSLTTEEMFAVMIV